MLLLSWVESNGNRSPRIVSGSNDNDLLLLVCYCARAPCFRLFAFWVLIFISPASFFHVFLSALLLLMLIAILRRRYSGSICRGGRFFFHWCCCWVVVQHCTHTHKYYRGLVCVCICRTRADSLCCVRDDDQGRCSDTDRYMSPHSTFLFLFATSFSISYSFFFFLSFLSLWDICRRNLGAVDPRINFCLLFPHIVRS